MKCFIRTAFGGALCIILSQGTGFAPALFAQSSAERSSVPDVPRTLSYQGFLQGTNGQSVSGDQPITVRLYSDSAGIGVLWEDTFLTSVAGGVFQIELGSHKPLPGAAVMGAPLWLGTSVGSTEEMRPLTALSAAPYALAIANNSVTAEKMATDYVRSISVNGQKLAGLGANVNFVTGDGVDLALDPSSHSIIMRSNGAKGSSGFFKGGHVQGDVDVDGNLGVAGALSLGAGAFPIESHSKGLGDADHWFLRLFVDSIATEYLALLGDAHVTGNTYLGSNNTKRIYFTAKAGSALDMNGFSIQNVGNPSSAQDVTTKSYVDNATSALNSAINTEIANRTAAVSTEASARTSGDNTLTTNLANEVTARQAAITSEASARSSADATESAARISADNTESTARQAADQTETTRATGAETVLQNNIDAEASTRNSNDQTLQSQLDAKAIDNSVVHITGDEVIDGQKSFTTAIAGDITGNAGSVTNGLYTTGYYSNPDWLLSLDASKITGSFTVSTITNLQTVLNLKANNNTVLHTTGNETFAGTKTFSSTIVGSINGNAATVTNGVVTTGSYMNPTWITQIASTKITGSLPQSQITDLVSALASKQAVILKGNGSLDGSSGTVDIPVTGTQSGDYVMVDRTAFAGSGNVTGNVTAVAGTDIVTVTSDQTTDNGSFLVIVIK